MLSLDHTQIQWNQSVALATLVVLYYDYLITLHLEVKRFWQLPFRTRKLGALLFYANRYFVLLASIPVFIFTLSEPRETIHSGSNDTSTALLGPFRCDVVRSYNLSILVLIQFWIIVQSIVRVHAFYGYSRSILGLLLFTAAASAVNGLVQIYPFERDIRVASSTTIFRDDCFQSYTSAQAKHMVAFWSGMLLIDLVVLALTLRKTWLLRREDPTGICTVTMGKAVFYFGVITLLHFADILISAIVQDDKKALPPLFAIIISSVLMSHLNLSLRDERLNNEWLNGDLDTDMLPENDSPMHFAPRLQSSLELESFPVQGRRRSVLLPK